MPIMLVRLSGAGHLQQVIGGQRPSPSKGPARDRRAGQGRGTRSPPAGRRSGIRHSRRGLPQDAHEERGGGSPERTSARGAGREDHLAAAGRATRKGVPGQREGRSSQEGPRTDRRWPEEERDWLARSRLSRPGAGSDQSQGRLPARGRQEATEREGTANASRASSRNLRVQGTGQADEGRTAAIRQEEPQGTFILNEAGNARATGCRLKPTRRLSGRARIEKVTACLSGHIGTGPNTGRTWLGAVGPGSNAGPHFSFGPVRAAAARPARVGQEP